MRRLAFALATLALSALALVCSPSLALAATGAAAPTLSEAQAYCVMDQGGNVLSESNAYAEMPMASITKIMTAIVALDSGKSMDDACTITEEDFEAGAQLVGYTSTDTPSFYDLMMSMLVYSGNDAADNVAINVAGSVDAFVELMNKKAQELGLTHTHFANPSGLEADGHYSCAHDLAVLGRYALENYPFIAQAVMTRSYTVTAGGASVTLHSTDDLMDTYVGLCGIKTGKVEFGTSFLGSAKRWGVQLFTCVLGCSTNDGRFKDTETLMDWAFDTYLNHVSFVRRGQVIRVANCSTSFFGKLLVSSTANANGRSYPKTSISYTTNLFNANNLVDPGGAYGMAEWTQDGRRVCSTTYTAGTRLYQIPAFNIFELPLFYTIPQDDAA
jgi:D-alanyl-D-alanine carboxypeptidase (penicillin-binding protein 5/6)